MRSDSGCLNVFTTRTNEHVGLVKLELTVDCKKYSPDCFHVESVWQLLFKWEFLQKSLFWTVVDFLHIILSTCIDNHGQPCLPILVSPKAALTELTKHVKLGKGRG